MRVARFHGNAAGPGAAGDRDWAGGHGGPLPRAGTGLRPSGHPPWDFLPPSRGALLPALAASPSGEGGQAAPASPLPAAGGPGNLRRGGAWPGNPSGPSQGLARPPATGRAVSAAPSALPRAGLPVLCRGRPVLDRPRSCSGSAAPV